MFPSACAPGPPFLASEDVHGSHDGRVPRRGLGRSGPMAVLVRGGYSMNVAPAMRPEVHVRL